MLLKAFYHQVGSLRETKYHRLPCTLIQGLPACGVLLRLAPRGPGSRDGRILTYFPQLDPAGKQEPP